VSAQLVGHDLMIQSTAADLVYILEPTAGTFQVGDSAAAAAASPINYSALRNIQVRLTGNGALVYVAGVMNPPDAPDAAGISGNFTVTASAGTTLAVEVHDGFTVKGSVEVAATGCTFVSHWTEELPGNSSPNDQFVDGVFLDANRRGSFGSVRVSGNGAVGLDGLRVLGNVNIYLGPSPNSSFAIDREWVDREDPDSPPWTKFQQDPTSIGGSLAVFGGLDAQIYNTNVAGSIYIAQTSTNLSAAYNLVIGGVSAGGNLTIRTPGGSTSGDFVDFATVGGQTSISQGSALNVLSLQSTYFGRTTSVAQKGKDYFFIDSEAALQGAGNLPNDSGYLQRLSDAGVRPIDSGSRFLQAVMSLQSGPSSSLVIGQDPFALTAFVTQSLFIANPSGSATASVITTSIPPTFIGYIFAI